ncbi:hypothetical protein DBR47_10635 [Paucibacter sp. KBW04]|nr:hypothetical protein DBR47_10635 [Paucibacter sp. KBW04]
MRVRGSAVELRALLRRWWGFFFVVLAVTLPYFSTVIGLPALPLFWAVQQGLELRALLALLAHALPALLLCWALREQMLPTRWLQAERALPLTDAQIRRADLAVLLLAQTPWILLTAGSMLAWRLASPAWMRGLWWGAGLGFVISLLLSSGLGLLLMQAHRRRLVQTQVPSRIAVQTPIKRRANTPISTWRVLLWLPLWRGPARPVLVAQLQGLLLAGLSLALAWAWPLHAAWFLALFTLVVMGFAARVHSLAMRCYEPLRMASHSLPVADEGWVWRLMVLAWVPAGLSWFALLLTLLAGPWALAPRAAPLFLLFGLVAPLLAIVFRGGTADLRAGRWLLSWGVWVALASEALL